MMLEPLKNEVLNNFTAENGYSKNLQLSRKISALRANLVPLMTEVQNLREKSRELEERYKKANQTQNAVELSMNHEISNLLALIGEAKMQLEEDTKEKDRLEKLTNKMKLFEERMKYDTDDPTVSDPAQKMKNELTTEIQAAESIVKSLTLKRDTAKAEAMQNEKQTQLWENLVSIFEIKLQCAEENKQSDGIMMRRGGAETLVLQ